MSPETPNAQTRSVAGGVSIMLFTLFALILSYVWSFVYGPVFVFCSDLSTPQKIERVVVLFIAIALAPIVTTLGDRDEGGYWQTVWFPPVVALGNLAFQASCLGVQWLLGW